MQPLEFAICACPKTIRFELGLRNPVSSGSHSYAIVAVLSHFGTRCHTAVFGSPVAWILLVHNASRVEMIGKLIGSQT